MLLEVLVPRTFQAQMPIVSTALRQPRHFSFRCHAVETRECREVISTRQRAKKDLNGLGTARGMKLVLAGAQRAFVDNVCVAHHGSVNSKGLSVDFQKSETERPS